MSRKLIAISFYARPDQYARLKATTARTKVPWTRYVREAIDEFIKARPDLFGDVDDAHDGDLDS